METDKLSDVLGKELPCQSGTTLLKVYRSDHTEFKKVARELGMTMTRLFSMMVVEASRKSKVMASKTGLTDDKGH